MLEAALWGLAANVALVLGAVLGPRLPLSDRALGLIMGFAGGALVSAVAFELAEPALERAGLAPLAAGVAVGTLAFFLGDEAISSAGGAGRKDIDPAPTEQAGAGGAALALALGVLLDGVPESAAIGIGLGGGGAVGIALVAAVFLSGFPESLVSARFMSTAGRTHRYVVAFWIVICALCVLGSVIGYLIVDFASEDLIAGVEGFAAGAILTMLAMTLFPEAYEHGGRVAGLVTTLGFLLALLLSEL